MNAYKHVLNPLKVMADPVLEGKHPCHNSRYIATADAYPDHDSYDSSDPEDGFRLERGSIIAKLTDCEHQAQYARLFAKSNEMLYFLRSATAELRRLGADCSTLDAFLANFNDIG